jgi:NTP pyrophosphatase (non-canonical NTP hydrolase)
VPRVVLLVTSSRLPPGLLTAEAWDLVRHAAVFTGAETGQSAALRASGADVRLLTGAGTADLVTALLAELDRHGTVVWLAGPDGDGELVRDLGLRLARTPGRADLEVAYGSWDPPGARLLELVAVIDRLSAPDGDPWKLAQTHQSLARFLLEEAYEAYDAMDAHDLTALREELGDVLLQVVLHSRMAEDADPAWSIDDVAADQVAKQIRRNPHVFAGLEVSGIDEITANWERIKQAEKGEASPLAGIAWAQPALALAAKVVQRAKLSVDSVPGLDAPATESELGELLFALVATAVERGLDPEAALRRVVQERYRDIG